MEMLRWEKGRGRPACMSVAAAVIVLAATGAARANVISGVSVGIGALSTISATTGTVPFGLAPSAAEVSVAPPPFNNTASVFDASVPTLFSLQALFAQGMSDVDLGMGARTTQTFTQVTGATFSFLDLQISDIYSISAVSGDFGALGSAGGTGVAGSFFGVPLTTFPLPNTVLLSVPGLKVTLNQQLTTGDGIGNQGLTVNGLAINFDNAAVGQYILNGDIILASSTSSQSATAVPEPSSLEMILFGLSALGVAAAGWSKVDHRTQAGAGKLSG